MKQRITLEQLNQLSEYQKERISSLWMPEKYDLAVATICKDAMNDEYEQFEFVIGEISVYEMSSYKLSVTLWDIQALNDLNNETSESEEAEEDTWGEEETSEEVWDEEEWYGDDDQEDIDFEYEFSMPSSFKKEECLPLLNIGQMIRILQDLDFKGGKFYIDVIKNKKYGIGGDIKSYDYYGNEYEDSELCDLLWESIKEAI